MCPLGVLCCMCGVPGHLAQFTDVSAGCVALRVQCSGPLGSCSAVCALGALCCVRGVLGHVAAVHRCARSVRCVARAVCWANWLLFTSVPARCVALCVPCPWPLGSCSPVCTLGVLYCVCRVLGHLAPVHRCVRSACCVATAVSWASWLLFTGVYVRSVVLLLRCPEPLGSCTPVPPLSVLCCVYGVLGLLASVHQCVDSVCCVACTVCWAPWLLFTVVLPWRVVLGAQYPGPLSSSSPSRVQCPGPLGLCSPVCALAVLWCVCGLSLRGAHLSICMAVFHSRQALGPVQASTRPSGRRLFHSRQGLGTLLGAYSSMLTAAVR